MRKVKFKKWIPLQYHALENGSQKPVDGTGRFENEFISEGMFHLWGNAYEEFNEGPVGNYTVAIVEDTQGNIFEVLPINLKFIN